MGLKTTNYTVKSTGETYETAYALIKRFNYTEDGKYATAHFVVHRTREKCETLAPLETKERMFKVNREENPYQTAYNLAKQVTETEIENPETHEKETIKSPDIFGGWQDDIVIE